MAPLPLRSEGQPTSFPDPLPVTSDRSFPIDILYKTRRASPQFELSLRNIRTLEVLKELTEVGRGGSVGVKKERRR